MKSDYFKKIVGKCDIAGVSMLLGAAAAILTACAFDFARECESMPDEVLRLHIMANSDSEEDQLLKYGLRDFLLSDLDLIFSEAENLEQANAAAEASLGYITERAEEFAEKSGFTYSVSAELTDMYFTTRSYGDFTLPAGNYKALKIVLGEGKGQNWWCVMFPPLCLPAAGKNENAYSEPYFSKEASKLIESGKNNIELRFAIFEWFKKTFFSS